MIVEKDIVFLYSIFVLLTLLALGVGMDNVKVLTVGRLMVLARKGLVCQVLISLVMTVRYIWLAIVSDLQGDSYEAYSIRIGAYGLLTVLSAVVSWLLTPKRSY